MLYCATAGFHCAAISQRGSVVHWPPGPDSPGDSLSVRPDAACVPGHCRLLEQEGCRMPGLQFLQKSLKRTVSTTVDLWTF